MGGAAVMAATGMYSARETRQARKRAEREAERQAREAQHEAAKLKAEEAAEQAKMDALTPFGTDDTSARVRAERAMQRRRRGRGRASTVLDENTYLG